MQEEQVLLEVGQDCNGSNPPCFSLSLVGLTSPSSSVLFKGDSNARKYFAFADSDAEMKSWISVIMKQLDSG